ncbi:MAG: ABC-type multidrug transport system fused ATPase/permease subunit [Kiritimatiellia bacterium]|jgi:ABC-type multidrug transport system fused ATPase/permease subunit
MMIVQQMTHYFSVYKKYIGKRLYVVFVLSLLASLTEGIGIIMLLPLIEAVDKDLGEKFLGDSGVKKILQNILDALGIGSSMVGILLFIAGVFLVKGLIHFTSSAYQSHLTSQLMRELKARMFDKYANMDYGYYSKRNTGHFINIINGQISGLIFTFNNFKLFLATIISTLVYIGMAFLASWQFASMAAVVGVLLLFSFRGLNNFVHKVSRENSVAQGVLNKALVQTLQSFKYLASTAQLGHLRKGVMASIEEMAGHMRIKGIAQGLTFALSEPITIFFILIVIIIQVVVLGGSLGPIFVALVLFNRALLGIMSIQGTWQATLSKIGSLELVEKEFEALDKNQERNGTVPVQKLQQQIELRDVTFAYSKDGEEVLKGVNLTIPSNSTVAFVGESGAGKSTLVDMLTLMLRPKSGEIFIDSVSSQDVELQSWRIQIGYVSQEAVIFDDTIANNICLWRDDFNQDVEARKQIEGAARQAYAEKFILNLPEQFNTVVGDRGVRLSGGQRQRLFLARELYKNPRLLILDEATSALDSESELVIQESIEGLKGSTTVAIIAHRLSTIKHADYIYVLDQGRVVEHGTFQELSNIEDGRFLKMVELQSL